jgi:predicted nucleotidyltransferase
MTLSHPFDTSLWEASLAEQAKKREEHRQRLLATTKEGLYGYFMGKQVKSVYLVGSLLLPERFYEFSDIDVAVAGLQEPYFRILRELEELLNWSVDIIELEGCRFRRLLENQGFKIK